MELVDIYDRDRRRTGRTKVRGGDFLPGEYHLVVHVCVFNPAGEMLIQKRHPAKDSWPGLWDVSMGGAAAAGETSAQAAGRELMEELGIQADFRETRPYLTVFFETGYDDFYFLNRNVDTGTLRLQEEEVEQARWASREETVRLLDSGVFIPYHRSFMELLFDMGSGRGSRRTLQGGNPKLPAEIVKS
jgi:isopentenyldiphosphate isomerase